MNTRTLPRGVSRYECRGFVGYLARYYAQDGRVCTQLFSVSRYAWDEARAQHAACQWLRKQAQTTSPRAPFRSREPRSNTGHMGITLTTKMERNGASFAVYQVSYVLGGKRCTKSFRVHMFPSQDAALAAALAFRRSWEARALADKQQRLQNTWTRALEAQAP